MKNAQDFRDDALNIMRFAVFAFHERLSSNELLQAVMAMREVGTEVPAVVMRVAMLMQEQAKAGNVMGVRELAMSLNQTAQMCEQAADAMDAGTVQQPDEVQ